MIFSVVIPTYRREEDLKKCLDSIFTQTVLPDQIIIVDDDLLPPLFLDNIQQNAKDKKIDFVYYQKNHKIEHRGSSASRNIGFGLSKNEIVFILDDDLILDHDFFETIMMVWQRDNESRLIGVGGIIKNNRKKTNLEKIYNKIFGLSSSSSWDINDVGFQVWDDRIYAAEKGFYAHGGACSYKKSLVEELNGFIVFGEGRTANEDVDFCLRAKKRNYYFIIEPRARVIHKRSMVSREGAFLTGFKDSHNRKIIFRHNCRRNLSHSLWFFWANFGWILRQFLSGRFSAGFGMIKGSLSKVEDSQT